MAKTTVLFDLDGTLLPMDQEAFVKEYLRTMAAYMAPYGYDPERLPQAVTQGVIAMVKNEGSRSNEQVFWACFQKEMSCKREQTEPLLEEYYRSVFQQGSAWCGFEPRAAELLAQVKGLGLQAVLATNPLFPAIATQSRVRWAGLRAEDFSYISSYENSSFCKPRPAYYREILEKLSLQPEECLMVGNDTREDTAAGELGIPVFLLTDCLIDRHNVPLDRYPHGSFPELCAYIRQWMNE